MIHTFTQSHGYYLRRCIRCQEPAQIVPPPANGWSHIPRLHHIECSNGHKSADSTDVRRVVLLWNSQNNSEELPVCSISNRTFWPQWGAVVVLAILAIIGAVITLSRIFLK